LFPPMPRLLRIALPGHPLHIIQRGTNRQVIFHSPQDKNIFLAWLSDAAKKHGLLIHTYVLMDNHIHLLVTPTAKESAARTMHLVGSRYVRYFNHRYARSGSLWQGRYRSTIVDTEAYFLTCMRYIELNPVRAGLVSQPKDYRWSGYQHNGEGWPDRVITEHPAYALMGNSTTKRRRAYQVLFDAPLEPSVCETIRTSTNQGWPLGKDKYREVIESSTKRRCNPLPLGRPRISRDRPQPNKSGV
jgi:putative transposase